MELKPVKLVLLGQTGVGKTSIIQRFVYNDFRQDPPPTIGANFTSRVVKPPNSTQSIRFHVWDTAGSQVYRSLIRMYYRDATVAVLVYNTTDSDSFEKLKYWLKKLKQETGSTLVLAVVGNKCDLHQKEAVKLSTAMNFAQRSQAIFSLTSAKDGDGVDELFTAIAEKLISIQYWLHPKFQVGDFISCLDLQCIDQDRKSSKASIILDPRHSMSGDHSKQKTGQTKGGCKC